MKFTLLALACLLALPGSAWAQSAITGVVRDVSGGVLPGVTVEASSDALIEGTRTVYSDGEGVYRVENLRPGTYAVVFTLPGFQTLRREGINLASEFTATINAELRVGALEESITITADAGLVDVTTAVHTAVLSRETIDSIPTGRTIQGMGQLIVGVSLNLPDTGGSRAMQQTYMSTHGMTSANNTVMVDGMVVNGLQSDGSVQSYFNDAMNQEVSYQTSGISADTSSGGVRLNMIPREGGNRFSGDFQAAWRPGDWQSDNRTQRHIDRGMQTPTSIDRIYDLTFSQGGPIKRDKLWFFGSARYITVNTFIPDTFFDDGSPGVDDQFIKSAMLRLTWQISSQMKLSAYNDEIDKFRGHDMQALYDPEESGTIWNSPAYTTSSAKLTYTPTSRLLLEGGWSRNLEYYTFEYQEGIEKPRFSPEWFAGAAKNELDLGGRRNAGQYQATRSPARYAWQASASYVTGSHSFKTGVQMTWGTFKNTLDSNAHLYQQNYGSDATGIPFTVPENVVVTNFPLKYSNRLNRDLGVYAQDSWTIRRLTVNAGIRWENLVASVLPGDVEAGRFVPARSFAGIENVPNWSDWAPRFALVYDVFGNARTALKYSLNRYNSARATGVAEEYNPQLVQTRTLAWTDLNGDDIAQGESNIVNGVRQSCVYLTPGCEINFATLESNYGIAALNEYGEFPRTHNIEHGLEIQHEVTPRLSMTGSWFRGQFYNLQTTINRSWVFDGDPLQNPNYVPFNVFNPLTGEAITIYGRTPAAQTAPTRNLDTFDSERERHYEAFSIEFRARPGAGAQLFGGFTVERQQDITCTAPDNPNTLRFCNDKDNDLPYRKQFKMSGSYPTFWGLTVSGSFQSTQGSISSQNIAITRGVTRYPASCPAPCPAGSVILPTTFQPATFTLQLVDQDTTFTERINQMDIKVSRSFRTGRVTISPTLEIFNTFNSDAVVTYVSTNVLNSAYLRPNSLLQGRMIGVGANVRW